MEIRHFQTFIEIIDSGGFTKAAEKLGYAQSTITSHVQILESEIGEPLFNRLGKNIVLTDMGKELAQSARKLLSIYNDITNIANNKNSVSGNLNIGAGESLSIYRLGPILKEYKKNYPNVNIVLKNFICSDLRKKLKTGELDIVLTIEPEVKDSDLITTKIKDEKMMIITPIGQNELNYQNIIFSEKGCSFRISFENYLKNKNISYLNPLEFSSIETIKKCVINGLGVSFLPLYTVNEEVLNKSLYSIDISHECQNFSTQMVYHKDINRTAAMEAFIETVLNNCKDWK
ncbi:MAG: LysR family transcriptional regulator [Solirubrobacterales bacterium]